MPTKQVILTDVSQNIYVPQATITAAEVGGDAAGYKISKYRRQGGLSDGVDCIEIDNGVFSFTVLPTRGMSLWRGKLGDWDVGWNSPIRGPVHPQYVPVMEPSGLGWLKGFDELLVRCGLESNGSPDFDERGQLVYPVHGRIGNLPAEYVELLVDGDTGEISLRGIVYETQFHFQKLRLTTTISTRVGEKGFRISDTVENLSADQATTQMLYHINFGPPLLGETAELIAPVKKLVPRNDHAATDVARWNHYTPPQPGFAEQVYFMELLADRHNCTQVMLKNESENKGVTVKFNKQQLPYFIVWKNQTAQQDGYVTGLEPSTNFPNTRSFEENQQRVVNLQPGGGVTYDLQIELHNSLSSIEKSAIQIAQLQQSQKPTIFDQSQNNWCE